jgi:sugar lactone lactonase YvrE
MVFGPDGALYYADSVDAYIYRIDASGHATVVAGIGPPGPGGYPTFTKDHGWTLASNYSGDGGPATKAQLSFPLGLAFDGAGNLYFADHGNDVIRRIDTSGIITTVAGVGPADPSTKGAWVPGLQSKGGDGGPATEAVLESPWGVTFDAAGNLYIADRDHDAIRRVDSRGIITTVAGTGQRGYSGDGGPATQAKLNTPLYVVFDGSGRMYVSDENNARIRRVSLDGTISTIAGTGAAGCSANQTLAVATDMANPNDLAISADGSLIIQQEDCNAVRRIDRSGRVGPLLGSGEPGCQGLAGGVASAAQVTDPSTLTLDASGGVYVAVAGCNVFVSIGTDGRTHVFAPIPAGG